MYELWVFHADQSLPTKKVRLRSASEVLTEIPKVLAQHPDCAHVEVMLGLTKLFAVDCAGNRLP